MTLHIHVGEPLGFERENGGCELTGSTADHLDPGAEEWLVRLDAPCTIGGERFGDLRLSPRYYGESLQRIANPLVNLAVNIVPHGGRDEPPAAMAGTVVRQREAH